MPRNKYQTILLLNREGFDLSQIQHGLNLFKIMERHPPKGLILETKLQPTMNHPNIASVYFFDEIQNITVTNRYWN